MSTVEDKGQSSSAGALVATSSDHLTKARGRIEFVDSLRGAAALWVFFGHSLHRFPFQDWRNHFLFNLGSLVAKPGFLGVHLFLVLSGFCLTYPLERRGASSFAGFRVPEFFRRRATRILPPYYVALLFCIPVYLIFNRHDTTAIRDFPRQLLMHILMLHNLDWRTVETFNPVFWSLALEWQLYFLFPIFIYVRTRFGAKHGYSILVFATFAISLAWQLGLYARFGVPQWTPHISVWYDSLPSRAFEFVCGMAAAHLVVNPHPRQKKIALLVLTTLPILGVLPIFLYSQYIPLFDQLWGLVFTSLILFLAAVDENGAFARSRFMAWSAFLGTFSYSLYLIHVPLTRTILSPEFLHIHIHNLLAIAAVRLAWFPIVLLLAYSFFRLFERPFMRSHPRKAVPAQASL